MLDAAFQRFLHFLQNLAQGLHLPEGTEEAVLCLIALMGLQNVILQSLVADDDLVLLGKTLQFYHKISRMCNINQKTPKNIPMKKEKARFRDSQESPPRM